MRWLISLSLSFLLCQVGKMTIPVKTGSWRSAEAITCAQFIQSWRREPEACVRGYFCPRGRSGPGLALATHPLRLHLSPEGRATSHQRFWTWFWWTPPRPLRSGRAGHDSCLGWRTPPLALVASPAANLPRGCLPGLAVLPVGVRVGAGAWTLPELSRP